MINKTDGMTDFTEPAEVVEKKDQSISGVADMLQLS